MRRDQVDLGPATMIAYGHYGRPVLVFASEQGRAWDFENNGMIGAVADLLDAGRVKFYCLDSADGFSWSNRQEPIEERARRHDRYEQWILDSVVPWIAEDCGGPVEIVTLGCSLGAYHAANIALRHAEVFPAALCFSGNYDVTNWHAWGDPGETTYFHNPMAFVANLHGDHLDWLRSRVSLLLVVGQGAWEENPTGSLPSTRAFADLLASKGIRYELDVWGYDIAHDWPSWRAQLRHHLPRFC